MNPCALAFSKAYEKAGEAKDKVIEKLVWVGEKVDAGGAWVGGKVLDSSVYQGAKKTISPVAKWVGETPAYRGINRATDSLVNLLGYATSFGPEINLGIFIGQERFEREYQGTEKGEKLGDFVGLAVNKVGLGMFMDAFADDADGELDGRLVEESLGARAYSISFHIPTTQLYTRVRNGVNRELGVGEDASFLEKTFAEVGAYNILQSGLYATQVLLGTATVAAIKELSQDPSLNVETVIESVVAFARALHPKDWLNFFVGFAINTPWLAPTGRFCMNKSREFFGAKLPEQHASEEKSLDDIIES